ncbi:MAG: tyrosine-type recombinase/integrase family protein, partial [Candidatus Microthrix sp.]|nr:tyrosine-type recombinase/integrase family protein [Candidatus Microthrix sp.]
MATKRRNKGENGSYRLCSDRYGCPPAAVVIGANGKAKKARPEHGKYCKAPWAYAIDQGIVGGKRVRHVVSAKTKTALLAKVDALKEKQSLGVNPNAQTVGDWLDYWLLRVAPANNVRPTTLKGYRSKVDLYLKPAVGHVKMQDLTPDHVERMQDWMRTLRKERNPGKGQPLSDTTIRQAHMILRSALGDALTRRKVTYNAAAVVNAPKALDNPHEQVELDEAKTVLKACVTARELCRNVVRLALDLRQGEALGLRWTD